jgi:hypothetical protein
MLFPTSTAGGIGMKKRTWIIAALTALAIAAVAAPAA